MGFYWGVDDKDEDDGCGGGGLIWELSELVQVFTLPGVSDRKG